MLAAIFFALVTIRCDVTWTPDPPTAIERELKVPWPAGTCRVSPCTTSIFSIGICRTSAAIKTAQRQSSRRCHAAHMRVSRNADTAIAPRAPQLVALAAARLIVDLG